MRFPKGQPVRLSTTVTDVTGAPADAGSLQLTVQNPDLTQVVFTPPAHDGTGLYHYDLPAGSITQIGHYLFVWMSTAANAGVSRGEFDVFDPFEPSVLSLQDAKSAVNINQATTTYDSELQAMLDTVTASLETITGGPAFNRSVSEYTQVSADYCAIVLRSRPVVSITSITDISTGTAISIPDITVDTNAGIVRRQLGLPFWSMGVRYQAVYLAGWGTAIPPAFNQAASLIVQHLWRTARGPGLAPVPNDDMTFLPGMSYAIPNRALEVMRPYSNEVYV